MYWLMMFQHTHSRMLSQVLMLQLEQVNNSMQMLVQQGVSVTVAHTVQRHREILHEYQDEYRKTKVQ